MLWESIQRTSLGKATRLISSRNVPKPKPELGEEYEAS